MPVAGLDDLSERDPRSIAAAIGRRISTGELAPGERLPTVRDVAAELGVSPATVSAAWQALRRAGLVEARGRAGSFVLPTGVRWLSPRVRGLVGDAGGEALDLSRGTPDPALLPDLRPGLERVRPRAGTDVYQESPVLPALRDVLADSWPGDVEAITVVDGAQDAVVRSLELLVGFGDRVAVEDPGYPPFLDALDLLGAEVIGVHADADGITAASLRRAVRAGAGVLLLQPRAQNPTGASLSPERAEELAGVLRRARTAVTVIEDDHSGAISDQPDVSLGAWLPDQVLHVRGFSKSYGPDLRIAALGGPADLVDRIVARRMLGPGWTSRMLQTILLDLLTEPASVAAVAHARRTYAGRQRAVCAALGEHGIELAVPDGINLWLPVREERAALVHLSAAGIRAAAGSPFLVPGGAASGTAGEHLRVTTGLVATEAASQVAGALAEAARAGSYATSRD